MGISAGMESLSEKSRLERLRSRHRDFYLALADEAEEGLRGPDQTKWSQIVQTEYDNFVQGLQWSLGIEDGDSALRLARAVFRVLNLRGDAPAAAPWLRKALEVPAPPSASRTAVLILIAEALRYGGSVEETLKLRQEAVEVARACGDRQAEVDALCALGGFALTGSLPASAGGRPKAKQLIEDALRLAKESHYERGEAEATWRFASYLRNEGDTRTSHSLRRRALDLYRKLGDIENVGWMTYDDAWKEGDPGRAKERVLEALDIARHLQQPALLAACFEVLIFIEQEGAGNLAAARRWAHQWEEELRAMNPDLQPWEEAWLLHDLGNLDMIQGRWHDARRRLETATSITAKGNYVESEKDCLLSLGRALLELEGYDSALSAVHRALEISRSTGYLSSTSLYGAALVSMAAGDLDRVRQMAQEGLELASQRYALSTLHELLLEVALEEGDGAAAERHLANLVANEVLQPPVFGAKAGPSRQDLLRAKVARHLGKLNEAQDLISSAASDLFRLQHRMAFAAALEEAAALRQAQGDSGGAGKILGAAKALRERVEYPVPQVNRRSYERLVEEVLGSLGEQAFGEALKAGAELSEQEALELLQSPVE